MAAIGKAPTQCGQAIWPGDKGHVGAMGQLIDGVLFRSGPATAPGLDVPLQLVVPTSMKPAIMNELHGTKADILA